jgi:hypothetical protein
MTDPAVASTAYQTAKSMGASDKVMLALFEAGIVESNFTNDLTATDHDSLGYLQQRPSAGWPNPTDVATATRSFVSRAQAIEGMYSSAGDLAQAVQRSAFPDRYNQHQQDAQSLLSQVSNGTVTGAAASTAGLSLTGSNPFQNMIHLFKDLIDPKWWRRVGLGVLGVGIALGALYFMFHEEMEGVADKALGIGGTGGGGGGGNNAPTTTTAAPTYRKGERLPLELRRQFATKSRHAPFYKGDDIHL